jgi:hypothetical protein
LTELQDFFAAHPRLMEQFPGGVVQFAQLAGNLPEEVLHEILVNAQILDEAAAEGALPHGEMPGGLPGDNFVQLNFGEEDDVEGEDPTVGGARDGAPIRDEAPPMLVEDEEDEEEEVEEVGIFVLSLLSSLAEQCQIAPLPIRVLRNLVGRFWGGSNVEEGSSEDGSQDGSQDLDGVD